MHAQQRNKENHFLHRVAVEMAAAGLVGVLLLMCASCTRGFEIPYDPQPADGRFGPDGIKISAQAVFSQGGVDGNVLFTQSKPGDPITIHVTLHGLDQYSDDYRWSIQEFPIRTSLLRPFPCSENEIGNVFDPANIGTSMCNNTEDDMCAVGDLTTKLGTLRPDMPWQTFENPFLTLTGPDSIIGRALVIDREDGPSGAFICANIQLLGARKEILRAAFENDVIQGDVIVRYSVGRDDVTIEADLYRVDDGIINGPAMWSINFGTPGPDNSCEGLGAVFGSAGFSEDLYDCSRSNQRECPIGDLNRKCGQLEFVEDRARTFCTDNQLGTVPRSYLFNKDNPQNTLLVAIRDENSTLLGCAPFEMIAPLTARAQLRYSSVFGDFLFWQSGPDDRTFVRVHLTGLNKNDFSLRIYSNPLPNTGCDIEDLGEVYSKQGGEFILPRTDDSPLTSDAGLTGSLDVLLPLPPGQISIRTTTFSSFLPLFGPYSIMDRTLALVREDTGRVVACSSIMLQAEYPQGELSSLLGYQDRNNPPLPSAL